MSKWIVKACEPLHTNLHLMLRYRLSRFQPYKRGKWSPSLEYFTMPQHQSHRGSKIWNRVVAAWGKMLPEVSFIEPQCFEEFLGSSFWWNEYAPVIGAGFSRARVGELHARGIRRVRDIWHYDQVRMLTCEEVASKYGLSPSEFGAWRLGGRPVSLPESMGRIPYWPC